MLFFLNYLLFFSAITFPSPIQSKKLNWKKQQLSDSSSVQIIEEAKIHIPVHISKEKLIEIELFLSEDNNIGYYRIFLAKVDINNYNIELYELIFELVIGKGHQLMLKNKNEYKQFSSLSINDHKFYRLDSLLRKYLNTHGCNLKYIDKVIFTDRYYIVFAINEEKKIQRIFLTFTSDCFAAVKWDRN